MAAASTDRSIPSDPSHLPLDPSHSLTPTRALGIHLPTGLHLHSASRITDLTPQLSSLFSFTLGITSQALILAHDVSAATPPPPVKYTLEKHNLLGTHLAIKDTEGHEIGDWELPVLKHGAGKGQILFPSGVPGVDMGVGQALEMKEGGDEKTSQHPMKRQNVQTFVKDGVVYFWELEERQRDRQSFKRSLFKIIDRDEGTKEPKKREVARYAQSGTHEREGLLVLDGNEVDELVVVFTVCAMLEAREHFP